MEKSGIKYARTVNNTLSFDIPENFLIYVNTSSEDIYAEINEKKATFKKNSIYVK
ncbi:MAG: hypothetical protein Q8873_02265 [Bacillota bacterium]|nr:hypothetical protein [Bacillota bacterium]